jgi:hypothetical protein
MDYKYFDLASSLVHILSITVLYLSVDNDKAEEKIRCLYLD